jgi:hypothetical protein
MRDHVLQIWPAQTTTPIGGHQRTL